MAGGDLAKMLRDAQEALDVATDEQRHEILSVLGEHGIEARIDGGKLSARIPGEGGGKITQLPEQRIVADPATIVPDFVTYEPPSVNAGGATGTKRLEPVVVRQGEFAQKSALERARDLNSSGGGDMSELQKARDFASGKAQAAPSQQPVEEPGLLDRAGAAWRAGLSGPAAALAVQGPLGAMVNLNPAEWFSSEADKAKLIEAMPFGSADLFNPHFATGIPVHYPAGSAKEDMQRVMFSEDQKIREATEPDFLKAPKDVPVIGGMSVGGLAFDMLATAPLALAMGSPQRVVAAGAQATKGGVGANARRLWEQAKQSFAEAAPVGAVYGADIPASDALDRVINLGSSTALAGLFGDYALLVGKAAGLLPSTFVASLRDSRKRLVIDRDRPAANMGRAMREVESAREAEIKALSGSAPWWEPVSESPSASGFSSGWTPRGTRVLEDLVQEATEKKLNVFSRVLDDARALAPGSFDRVVQETQMTAGALRQAAKDMADSASAMFSTARGNMDRAATRLAGNLEARFKDLRSRQADEIEEHLLLHPEMKTRVVPAKLIKKWRDLVNAGVNLEEEIVVPADETAPLPYAGAPGLKGELEKLYQTVVFQESPGEPGKVAAQIRDKYGPDIVRIEPLRAASDVSLSDPGVEAKNIRDRPSSKADQENDYVAYIPREIDGTKLDSLINSINHVAEQKNAPYEIKALQREAYQIRDTYPQYAAMKKRHEAENKRWTAALQAVGIHGLPKDEWSTGTAVRNVRAAMQTHMGDPGETPLRADFEDALRLAGMEREIGRLRTTSDWYADALSLVPGGDKGLRTAGGDIEARRSMASQMYAGDEKMSVLASTVPGQEGLPAGAGVRDAMKRANDLQDFVRDLGLNPDEGILTKREKEIQQETADAILRWIDDPERWSRVSELFDKVPGESAEKAALKREARDRLLAQVPSIQAYVTLRTGDPTAHLSSAGGLPPSAWQSMPMHSVLTLADPYFRAVSGVDPRLRQSGKGEAGLAQNVVAGAQGATEEARDVSEAIKGALEFLKKFAAEATERKTPNDRNR